MSDDVKLAVRRRRAIYRARHRGTKEMDWLLGRFAAAEIDAMSEVELTAFERFLTLPDPDVEYWITDAPDHVLNGEWGDFVRRLRRFHGLEADEH